MFRSFIFQIIAGVCSIYEISTFVILIYTVVILISNIEANGYWLYSINSNDYYIPNHGFILKIWDFGRSMIINTDEFSDICNQIIHQCKRFYKDAFKKS